MSSAPSANVELQGAQRPRVCSVPRFASTSGDEAVELAAMAGLVLDPWEEFVLRQALGERADGKWAAFEIGLDVSRQNGKGAILEARELAGLFLLAERLLIHSAHQFDTSLEAFRRLLFLIENTDDLIRRVKRVSRSHGEEGIELIGGQRIRFRTRTKGGGRGFTADCVIFDEAMYISEMAHGAILPTLSARPNPQVWYTGSAVDQWTSDDGIVFARVRQRGHKHDPGLCYFEWSVPAENPEEITEEAATDPQMWAMANPGLGIRISAEHIAREQRSMDARTFAVERLGAGDWPNTEGIGEQVIPIEVWNARCDEDSRPLDPVCFAFDVTPDRSSGSIGVAGRREDGRRHVEVIERDRGTAWIVDRLPELLGRHEASAVICDGVGPAASLLGRLEQLDIEVITTSTKEYGQAYAMFVDGCEDDTLRHLGTAELTSAVKGAAKRTLGDAWAWSRKSSSVDISPLVACTLALWGTETQDGPSVYEERGLLTVS